MEAALVNSLIVSNRPLKHDRNTSPTGFILWFFNLIDKIVSAVHSILCCFSISNKRAEAPLPKSVKPIPQHPIIAKVVQETFPFSKPVTRSAFLPSLSPTLEEPVLAESRFKPDQFLEFGFSESESRKIAEYLNTRGKELQNEATLTKVIFVSKTNHKAPASFRFLSDGTIYIHIRNDSSTKDVAGSLKVYKRAVKISPNGEMELIARLVTHLDQPEAESRIRDEISASEEIQGIPQTPSIHCFIESENKNGVPTMSEYLENFKDGSLRLVIDKPLAYHKKECIAEDLIYGLEQMHLRNIAHGDIKPHNILVDLEKPKAVYSDFEFITKRNNNPRGFKGTFPYTSPEKAVKIANAEFKNEDEFTNDVWSLGLVLAQLYIGFKPPYYYKNPEEIENNLIGLANKKGGLLNYVPYVKTPMMNLIARMLSYDPAERPKISDVADAWQSFKHRKE